MGLERDDETGFYCMGARYYCPWLGRWTTADPIGLAAGVNPFLYCRAGPVTLSDPSGLEPPKKVDPSTLRSFSFSGFIGDSKTGELTPFSSTVYWVGDDLDTLYDSEGNLLTGSTSSEGNPSGTGSSPGGGDLKRSTGSTAAPPDSAGIDTLKRSAYERRQRIRDSFWGLEVGVLESGDPTGSVSRELDKTKNSAFQGGRRMGKLAVGIAEIYGAVQLMKYGAPLVTGGGALALAPVLAIAGAFALAVMGVNAIAGALSGSSSMTTGGSASKKPDPNWKSTQKPTTKENADLLRANMKAKGTKFNANDNAHHIVPGRHSLGTKDQAGTASAQGARNLLDRYQIDVNQAENGVKLTPTQHHQLHSGKVYDETFRRLSEVENMGIDQGLAWGEIQEALLAELQQIGGLMTSGGYP